MVGFGSGSTRILERSSLDDFWPDEMEEEGLGLIFYLDDRFLAKQHSQGHQVSRTSPRNTSRTMPLALMRKEDSQEANLKWYCMTVVVNRGPLKVPADDHSLHLD